MEFLPPGNGFTSGSELIVFNPGLLTPFDVAGLTPSVGLTPSLALNVTSGLLETRQLTLLNIVPAAYGTETVASGTVTYLYGGASIVTSLKLFYTYQPSTLYTPITVLSSPHPKIWGAACLGPGPQNERGIYLTGGYNGQSSFESSWFYNFRTKQWSPASPMRVS